MSELRAKISRQPSRRPKRGACRVERLEDRRLLAVAVAEQEFVYLLNRARHDPAAYARQQNLPVDLSSVTARGPLAINSQLTESSEVKAKDLATNNYFAHVSPRGVHANQLVTDAGYELPSYFPAQANSVESLAAGTNYDEAIEALNLLIIDEGVPGAGHRRQLLGMGDFYAANRDVGAGYHSSANSLYTNYWAIHLAQRADPKQLLTGVVFEDADGDSRYDAGEGLSGVTITVDGSSVTRTNAAGGWSLVASEGEHTVSASGGNFVGHSSVNATVGTDNVAVDFVSGRVAGQVSFEEMFGTNVGNRIDVDSNGGPSAIDALIVINHIGVASTGTSPIYDFDVYLDVNGDGNVSAIDALQVINGLAQLENAAAGESLSIQAAIPASTVQAVEGDEGNETSASHLLTGSPASRMNVGDHLVKNDAGTASSRASSSAQIAGETSGSSSDPDMIDLALLSLDALI